MVQKKHSSTPSSTTSDLSDDPDTEEALKGFDFLASPDELDGTPESRSCEDSGEWGERVFTEPQVGHRTAAQRAGAARERLTLTNRTFKKIPADGFIKYSWSQTVRRSEVTAWIKQSDAGPRPNQKLFKTLKSLVSVGGHNLA